MPQIAYFLNLTDLLKALLQIMGCGHSLKEEYIQYHKGLNCSPLSSPYCSGGNGSWGFWVHFPSFSCCFLPPCQGWVVQRGEQRVCWAAECISMYGGGCLCRCICTAVGIFMRCTAWGVCGLPWSGLWSMWKLLAAWKLDSPGLRWKVDNLRNEKSTVKPGKGRKNLTAK